MYNVVLIDDEPRTIDALEKNVDWRRCGIRKVYKAYSMEAAVSLLEKEPVEILICDIEMPGGTGLQLLEWVREQKRQMSCIFVTCHPEFDYMRKAIQLKCYDYILKPINYEEFAKVLKELVYKMEAKELGTGEAEAVNWGGMTDWDIREQGRQKQERNVEQEVKRYIREHMVDNITVADIAEALHFNAQYLMRAFKGKTGLSIIEYITQARVDTAKKILRDTKLPIKEVANLAGYGDYAYFARVFRKETGKSPSQYRNGC